MEKEIEAKEVEHRNQTLSGQITGSSINTSSRLQSRNLTDFNEMNFDTLDEPIWDTINRDLGQITAKFAQVLIPTPNKKNLLRDWDLWVNFLK